MAFKEIAGTGAGGNVLKWTTVGQRVAGRLIGFKNGKVFNSRQSRLAVIDVGNGVQQTIPLPSDLTDDKQIEFHAKPGYFVDITLVELVPGKQPQPYKKFKLIVDDAPGAVQPQPAQVMSQVAPPAWMTPATPPATPPPAQAAPPVSEYDVLAAKLTAHVGAGSAGPMLNALQSLYPDPAARIEQLKIALKSQGVAF